MGKHNGTRSASNPSFQHVFLNVYVCVSVEQVLAEEMTEHTDKHMCKAGKCGENAMQTVQRSKYCAYTREKKVKYSHCNNYNTAPCISNGHSDYCTNNRAVLNVIFFYIWSLSWCFQMKLNVHCHILWHCRPKNKQNWNLQFERSLKSAFFNKYNWSVLST